MTSQVVRTLCITLSWTVFREYDQQPVLLSSRLQLANINCFVTVTVTRLFTCYPNTQLLKQGSAYFVHPFLRCSDYSREVTNQWGNLIMEIRMLEWSHFSWAGSMSLKTWTVSVLLELTRYMSSVLKDRQLIWMNLRSSMEEGTREEMMEQQGQWWTRRLEINLCTLT